MTTLTKQRLEKLFSGFAGKRIAIIGDLMLDRYYWGHVGRISPEAPVPVVEVESESTRLGGAANVAHNVASLGGVPLLMGVIGNDGGGVQLRKIVESSGFPTDGVVIDSSRPTTVKTRVIAHHQHVVRIDNETKEEISSSIQRRVVAVLEKELEALDGIILQDYNKGVLVKNLITEIVGLAKKGGKAIAVDPKFNNFFEYKNVTIFKPNRKETEEALGCRLNEWESIDKAGKEMLRRLQAENVLLTLGEKGMSLFERGDQVTHLPTRAIHIADVSGAGDTVVSTLAMVLASGGNIKEAATLANFAGGIVCGEVGIVPVDKQVLFDTVAAQMNHVPN
ncbi:MAG: D-glycero-beta-D-manno-heptose-7-phosphate kinase [Ignavibacteriales bacterium]|nr:D-glycero-beta-D-manno-heptose-7-phosphate kinase [Ignavibacteriales bacterium]